MFYEINGKTYIASWSDIETRDRNLETLARWCKRSTSEPGHRGRPILHVIAYPDVDDLAAKVRVLECCAVVASDTPYV